MKELIEVIGSIGICVISFFIVGLTVWLIYHVGYGVGKESVKDDLIVCGLAEYYIDYNSDKAWRIKEKFTSQIILDENKNKGAE